MDKLTPGQLRDLAALNDAYDKTQYTGRPPQTRGGFLRDEAARREGEAKAEPFKPCLECINDGTCKRIGCYQATNASAATPPAADLEDHVRANLLPKRAADAPDELVQRLRGGAKHVPEQYMTPGLRLQFEAADRIEADARKIADITKRAENAEWVVLGQRDALAEHAVWRKQAEKDIAAKSKSSEAAQKRVAELEAALFAVVNDPDVAKLSADTILKVWGALPKKGAANG